MKTKKMLIAIMAGLLILTIVFCWIVWDQSRRKLQQVKPDITVTVLDVGQGDSVFVEWSNGTQMLIDGGVDATVLNRLGEVMLPWDRTIDYIVATHPHADHVGGLITVLDRFTVEHIVLNVDVYDSPVANAFLDAVMQESAQIIAPRDLNLAGVRVMYPTDNVLLVQTDNPNETSIVLAVDYKQYRLLFMGDIGETVEQQLIQAQILEDVDILKVGHHGSKYSSSRAFLEVIQPEIALISAGKDNVYHHPHPSALQRLLNSGATVYRTDQDGTITIRLQDNDFYVITGNQRWTWSRWSAMLSAY
ncbi:TPA: MBL fold metallo-hydrolase [Candidatus Uhrbacteria bacterium]|nr:MBL fold metallo-hydrolase [Candidatus Uhrbacteria bacterium]